MVPTWAVRERFDWHACPHCRKYTLRWAEYVAACTSCGEVVRDAVARDIRERKARRMPTMLTRRAASYSGNVLGTP
jgi:hypothetical protein